MLPLAVLSLFIITLLFLTTYLPQVAFLLLFHKAGSAFVNGAFLVLGEANIIIAIIFEALLVDKTQVDVFDAVMVARGHADLIRERRPVDVDSDLNPRESLGPREKGAEFAPFSFRQIVEFVVFLPLNFIPYVGVPIFLLLTGYRAGPLLQYRYHRLKGMNRRERKAFVKVKARKWQYMWFGTVALVLQLIPVLSMFFLLTTATGSALWAADMEDAGRTTTEDRNDAPPEYTDEP